MEPFAKETLPISLEEEMRRSYLDYAMSVIVGRALPDVRDGLKPVHRRVLYAMHEANNTWNRPYVKCARIVGEVLGKYHPHGDTATYEALVRMAQDFSMRYTLVDGQGNFGSVDGDAAAAYRYTECRLDKIASEMLLDIDKETVDFTPNYDGKELEPAVLPTRVPNLLVNGSSGIAVGMATNIPPHNLGEVVDACLHVLAQPHCAIEEVIKLMPAPDFPTAGIISGMRVVIELKRGEIPEVVLNNLFKQTQLQDTFGINMVALVDGQPRLLSVKELIEAFISHRREVVTRRAVYDLRKARERAHVLEGLAVALSNVDEVIDLIKKAPTPTEAKRGLMARPWGSDLVKQLVGSGPTQQFRPDGLAANFGIKEDGYHLSDEQAQAILELRLQRLTGLERDKIRDEYREVIASIVDLLDILAKPSSIVAIIADELRAVREQYPDPRRSEIVTVAEDIAIEDLIAPQDMVVTFSHGGYVKSQPLADYRAQRRGGRGKMATTMKEDDFIERLFVAHSHDYLLCFSNRGTLYWLKVYEVPAGSRSS